MADKEGLQAWTSTLQKNIAVKKHGLPDTGRLPHPSSPRGAWPLFALTQSTPDMTRLCPLCLDRECTPKLAALLRAQALTFPTSYSLPCDNPILLFLHLPVQLSSPASSASPGLCPRPAISPAHCHSGGPHSPASGCLLVSEPSFMCCLTKCCRGRKKSWAHP